MIDSKILFGYLQLTKNPTYFLNSYLICLVLGYIGRYNVGRNLDKVVHGIMHQLPLKRGLLRCRHVQGSEKIQCCALEVSVDVDAIKERTKKRIHTVKKRSLSSEVSHIILAVKCQLLYEEERIWRVEKHVVGEAVSGGGDQVLLSGAPREAAHS